MNQQPAFHIRAGHAATEELSQYRLLMEISPRSFSYLLLHMSDLSPAIVKYFELDPLEERSLAETLRELIDGDEILSGTVKETCLVYNFPESSLVPENFFSSHINKELTDIMYGNLNKGLVLSEKVPGFDIYNVYRIPADIHGMFQKQFTAGRYWHYYSLQLSWQSNLPAADENGWIKVIFYADRIVVLVFLGGQPQLLQTFAYHDSKDVAYYLLNCSQLFNLSPEQLVLELSGLIDVESAMYTELEKYFRHIGFEQLPYGIPTTDGLDGYPLHFFSSLLKMAVCV
jgi:hypothetical protein